MAECREKGLDKMWLEYIGTGQAALATTPGKPEGKEEQRSNVPVMKRTRKNDRLRTVVK